MMSNVVRQDAAELKRSLSIELDSDMKRLKTGLSTISSAIQVIVESVEESIGGMLSESPKTESEEAAAVVPMDHPPQELQTVQTDAETEEATVSDKNVDFNNVIKSLMDVDIENDEHWKEFLQTLDEIGTVTMDTFYRCNPSLVEVQEKSTLTKRDFWLRYLYVNQILLASENESDVRSPSAVSALSFEDLSRVDSISPISYSN